MTPAVTLTADAQRALARILPRRACCSIPELEDLFRLVLSLEGTLSGEHGVGLEKRDYVAWEVPAPSLAPMHEIKRIFDPRGILNPGKMLPAA